MRKFAFACVVTLLLAGCSTPQQPGSAPTTEPAPAVSAQPVRIPAESSKKVVLMMTGAQVSVDAADWADFKEEWRATFAEHAKLAGIAFAMREENARTPSENGTALTVYINDYRKVGIGSRIFFGVMTGNDYINAKVTFSDLITGQRFGEQSHNTSSTAWAGVFAKMTPQQIDAIATEVFREIKSR